MWPKLWKKFPKNKTRKVRIEHDNGVYVGPVSLVFVALTNSIGGFESVAPDAKLDDGNFTLILVKTAKIIWNAVSHYASCKWWETR